MDPALSPCISSTKLSKQNEYVEDSTRVVLTVASYGEALRPSRALRQSKREEQASSPCLSVLSLTGHLRLLPVLTHLVYLTYLMQ